MLGPLGVSMGMRGGSDGWGMGGRQWSRSDCPLPAVWLWPQGRGEWVESSRSRGPPWEEEMDKATSLGPQEFQAPGLEQLS